MTCSIDHLLKVDANTIIISIFSLRFPSKYEINVPILHKIATDNEKGKEFLLHYRLQLVVL